MRSNPFQVVVLAPEPYVQGHRGQGNRIQHLLDVAFRLIADENPGHAFDVVTSARLALAAARQMQWGTKAVESESMRAAIETADILVILGSPADMRIPDYAFARSRPSTPTYQLYLPREF